MVQTSRLRGVFRLPPRGTALLDLVNGPVRAKGTALRSPSRPDHAKVQIFHALGVIVGLIRRPNVEAAAF